MIKLDVLVPRDVVYIPRRTAGLGETTTRIDARMHPGLEMHTVEYGVEIRHCGHVCIVPWGNIAQVFCSPPESTEPKRVAR